LSVRGLFAATLLAAFLPVACPAFAGVKLPAPTGNFRVATKTIHLVDESRAETFLPNEKKHRELMVQFWYPAETAGPAAPYDPLPEPGGMRKFFVGKIETNSSLDAPAAQGGKPFPVLIFSPQWDGQRWQNTALAEELASHGFIVAGIDHPFGSAVTMFPDGRTVHADSSLAIDFSTDAASAKFLENAGAQLQLRSRDVRFVLDQIEKLNAADGWLSGRVDLRRAGVFGHSFGGAVAAEVCVQDARFRAGLNMDGCLFGAARSARLNQPFFLIN
jgi:predicted dienelactone hydrolase